MSSVSGSAAEQRALIPETGGHLRQSMGDTSSEGPGVPECPSVLRAPKDVTCGTKRHAAVETRGGKVKNR